MQMKHAVYEQAEQKFHNGYDEGAYGAARRKASSFHFFAAYGVDEQQTNAAGKCHGGVGIAAPQHFQKGIKAAAGEEQQTVFADGTVHGKQLLFHDFPFQYARFLYAYCKRSNKFEINKHQKRYACYCTKRRKLCIISTDRKTERQKGRFLMKRILVTGGTGYIGSHTCISLLEKGYDVTIVDNLVNSKALVVDRIENLSGKKVKFFEADVCDEDALRKIFAEDEIFAVIHFAGLKAVGESVQIPLRYYENNLISTLSLLKVMAEFKVNNFVFSSSATVYGNPASVPIREDFPLSTTNPYGTTKLMIERILKDYAHANPDFNPIILRYFNPVGAHESGTIGEDPNGIPNNLVPYITQVAVGKLRCLGVFGDDYPTKDGTGVRDYIHVVDLAEGHVAALKKFDDPHCGVKIYNLGTGVGYSVLDIVHAFEKCVGHKIPYEIKPRRAGDIPECYADCTKAYEELGWKAQKTLDDMCADSWRWQTQNPNGYNG